MAVLQVFQAKMLAIEEAGLDAASLRDLRSATDLVLHATNATAQAIGRSMSSLIVLECHLWLTLTELKEADKFPSSTLRFCQAAYLDQLWRALLNASQRLRSRLKRCNTSSLSAPALLLLPVAPGLCRLNRQQNQRQPPLSPDLLRVGEIEGAHARYDATPSRSAKDPGPRLPWIQRLRNPPDQPGRRRGLESRYHWTTLQADSNVPLSTPLNAGCKGKCVFGSLQAHYSAQVYDRCDKEQNKTHTFSKREQ